MKRRSIALSLGAVVLAGALAVCAWHALRTRDHRASQPPVQAESARPATPAPLKIVQRKTRPRPVLTPAGTVTLPAAAAFAPVDPEDPVTLITGADAGFSARVRAAQALSEQLSAAECGRLTDFLLERGAAAGLSAAQTHALKNEVLNSLGAQKRLPAGFVSRLEQLFADPAQDVVLRDYALQHLHAWSERATAEEQVRIRQRLWSALEQIDSSLAGTALHALRDELLSAEAAGQSRPEDRSRLGAAALHIARSAQTGELARITALSVCGRLKSEAIRPLALELAGDAAASVPVRLAAIAALGELPVEEPTRTALRALLRKDDPRLTPAALAALRRLRALES